MSNTSIKEIFFETALVQYENQGIFIFLDSNGGWWPTRQTLIRNGVLEIYDDGSFGLYGTERIYKIINFDDDFENNHEVLDKYCNGEIHTYKKMIRDPKKFFLEKKEVEIRDFKKGGFNALKKGKDFRLLVLTGKATITIGGKTKIN